MYVDKIIGKKKNHTLTPVYICHATLFSSLSGNVYETSLNNKCYFSKSVIKVLSKQADLTQCTLSMCT